jgi:hypothetical protein
MPTLIRRLRNAMAGATTGFMATEADDIDLLSSEGFGTWRQRNLKYAFLERVTRQDAFRKEEDLPEKFATRDAAPLYKFIRDILGIAHILVEFHTTHTFGGSLDPLMGDGEKVPSAMPILMSVERPQVREALAMLVKRSNWNTKKDLVSRLGCMLGDVFVQAEDDVRAETVRLQAIHPNRVKRVVKDAEGNIQEYEFEWKELHPLGMHAKTATYNEVCWREGGKVWYRTYLDKKPFAWPTNPYEGEWEWSMPYDFVPLKHIQHKDVGLGWGEAEVEPAIPGWRELSDLGSCMTDWCRRALHSPHLISGMPGIVRSPSDDIQDRDTSRFLFASSQNASAKSLLVPLPVGEVCVYLEILRQKQKEDFPEVALQVLQTTGTPSGESIRRAREPAGAKVLMRREAYNGPVEAAMKMALSIGGIQGYEGYQGIRESDFDRGVMDFRIGPTPVFGLDPIEAMEEKLHKFTAMESAVRAGFPLEFVMTEFGYTQAEVNRMAGVRDKAAQASLANMRKSQQLALSDLRAEEGVPVEDEE